MFGNVTALATHRGELFAGGLNLPGSNVLRWIAGSWAPVGMTLSGWWSAEGLITYRGELIAISQPIQPGASGIVRWDGRAWSSLGAGTNHSGFALLIHDDLLIAGGLFTSPTPYWARWGCPCYADCDNSGDLTVADFGCFQTQFVASHPYTDCNSDGAFTVQDFGCFQSKFVAGCR
jgi:hypothetical protein